ncbi:MAG: hypothetical protein SF162_11350 [bacterium]|nr:hypothetical protein [bacterium]
MGAEQIGTWAGFVLTLMVFSYLLGDNVLYRLAVYTFAGLTAGFVTIVTLESVIAPWLNATFLAPQPTLEGLLFGVIPLVLGLLLLIRTSRRYGRVGAVGLAFVIGIGTAVALVGAVSGTLIPLTVRTVEDVRAAEPAADGSTFTLLNGFIVAVGVICTLVYFQYAARRVPGAAEITRRGLLIRAIGAVGQGFLVVTLAALYGGAILTGLTIVSDRLVYLLARLFGGG